MGHHLPDRGQAADHTSPAMVWQTASPRAHVATPGRACPGPCVRLGPVATPGAAAATSARERDTGERRATWAGTVVMAASTCRIAVRRLRSQAAEIVWLTGCLGPQAAPAGSRPGGYAHRRGQSRYGHSRDFHR
jgi:hypothetical protein